MGVGGQRHTPATLPPEKIQYPLFIKMDGAWRWSGQLQKISPLSGFDSQTVQPIGSRCINYATRPTAYFVKLRALWIVCSIDEFWCDTTE